MAAADATLRVELIRLLADRRATTAAPTLLAAAKDEDAKVREAAVAALGVVADADALPALVGLLAEAKGKRERAAVEKAVVAACGRIDDEAARAKPVVAALAGAKDAAARVVLVRVLGRIGGGTALEAIRTASKDANADVQDAAVRALAEWQSAKVAADLLRIATSGTTLVHHVLALRGYVRVIGLPSGRPAAETLKLYEDALGIARRDDERRLVLAGIAGVADPAAAKIVEPFLAKPALADEAAMALVRIGKAISGSHKEAARATLNAVLDAVLEGEAHKLATQALDEMDKFADYLTAWQVAGPYTKAGFEGPRYHNEKFPPELDGGKDATWQTMPPGGDEPKLPYLMDLYKRFKKENSVAYLRTHVWSPQAQPARLEFGSDDGARVWLNGKPILSVRKPRSFKEAEDKVEVALKEGWNALLVKVWNGGLYWSIAARLRAPDGSKLEGLRASIDAK
jgi:HEAT repeat protein